MISWRSLRKEKKSNSYTGYSNKNAIFPKYNNNLGYNLVLREKQEEFAIWYEGDSNALLDYYISASPTQTTNPESFRNSRDYFWNLVAREPEVKCTHSGLPKEIINTLVRILGKPKITASKEETVEGNIKEVDDINLTDIIDKIIEDNDFYSIHSDDQLPYGMVVGDGAYFINIDPDLSDYPIIEFIDGRNVEFERKANRITSVIARKYYVYNDKGYMLTDTRSTKVIKDEHGKKKRVATVEYHLYELVNPSTDEVRTEVELNKIPDTALLENLEYHNIDIMLAVPVVFNYDKDSKRGKSFFAGKLDLFDDLDQSISQTSNVTRLSTPVDYIPEGLIDYDKNGRPKNPKRYDRRFVVLPADRNAVGQNLSEVKTTQPSLNFSQYNEDQLEIVMKILTGLMSPATLGIDLARKDNATAQREKEKVTLVTRDALVDKQTSILTKLFNLVLKVYAYMQGKDTKTDFKITVNYPEYANPTFENKLSYLTPAYVSGGMSEEKYVDELWEDALSEEEKEREIATLKERRNSSFQQYGGGPLDNIMLE